MKTLIKVILVAALVIAGCGGDDDNGKGGSGGSVAGAGGSGGTGGSKTTSTRGGSKAQPTASTAKTSKSSAQTNASPSTSTDNPCSNPALDGQGTCGSDTLLYFCMNSALYEADCAALANQNNYSQGYCVETEDNVDCIGCSDLAADESYQCCDTDGGCITLCSCDDPDTYDCDTECPCDPDC